MTMVAEIMACYLVIYRQRTQNLIHTSIAIPLVIKKMHIGETNSELKWQRKAGILIQNSNTPHRLSLYV